MLLENVNDDQQQKIFLIADSMRITDQHHKLLSA